MLASLTAVVYGLMQLWQVFAGLVQTITVGAATIINALASLAAAANHIATGEFSQILPSLEKPWSEAAANLEAIWTTRLDNMRAEGQSFVATITNLFSNLRLSLDKGLTVDFDAGRHAAPDRRPAAPWIPETVRGGGRGRAPKDTSDQDAKDAEEAALERLKTEEKVDDEILARRTKLIEAAYAAGKISLDQETALLGEQLDKKWALDQDYFAKKIAAAQGDDKEQQKLRDEELIAYQDYLTKRQELDAKYYAERQAAAKKAAADEQAAFDKALAPIEKGFDQAIQGFLQGTQSLRQALQKGLQAIIVQSLEETSKTA